MSELYQKRVIEKAKNLKWQSRLFTVPKKDSDKERLILDLSLLNSFINRPTFKMLTLREVKLLLPQGYWTTSIDLRDGYWHIPITPGKRPYLGFSYNDQDWQFRAMPFGLNIAPRTFTKIISHVIRELAQLGIWCLPYLDDLLIVAPSQEECQHHTKTALEVLNKLGFIINEHKTRLTPQQVFQWLGIEWDLISHTAQVSTEKVQILRENISNVVRSGYCTKKTIQSIQGLANWVGMCDRTFKLILPTTRRILRIYSTTSSGTIIKIPLNLRLRLCKWRRDVVYPQRLGTPTPDIIIQTDATPRAWGLQINGSQFRGNFDKSMRYSINVLELLTVFLALLLVSQSGITIQILCDNLAAIQVLQRGGSTYFHLSSLVEIIWRRAAKYNWTLQISHIKGQYNVIADMLSRNDPLSSEWSLSSLDFKQILLLEPHLEVDLFATSFNNKLPTFLSPCPDKTAAGVDALATSWDKWKYLYMFPPTPLIPKVIAKIMNSHFRRAVLVTQDTPTRPWFMSLQLRKIPSVPLTAQLSQIVVDKVVSRPSTSKLRVWLFSGEHTKKESQRTQEF